MRLVTSVFGALAYILVIRIAESMTGNECCPSSYVQSCKHRFNGKFVLTRQLAFWLALSICDRIFKNRLWRIHSATDSAAQLPKCREATSVCGPSTRQLLPRAGEAATGAVTASANDREYEDQHRRCFTTDVHVGVWWVEDFSLLYISQAWSEYLFPLKCFCQFDYTSLYVRLALQYLLSSYSSSSYIIKKRPCTWFPWWWYLTKHA